MYLSLPESYARKSIHYTCTVSPDQQKMLVVLAERLAQIIDWFKSAAGYRKLNANLQYNTSFQDLNKFGIEKFNNVSVILLRNCGIKLESIGLASQSAKSQQLAHQF